MSTDKAAKKSSSERRDLYIVHQHCPDRPYLELEVPEDFLKPRFIEFEVDSRDQGWASDKNSAPWTWFDVLVRRPPGRNNLRVFQVCKNRVGNPNFHRQTMRWIPSQLEVNRRLWMNSLAPGDVIELVPKAMFVGWVNIVRQARIMLEYEPTGDQPGSSSPSTSTYLPFGLNAPLYRRQLNASKLEIRLLAVEPGSDKDPIVSRLIYSALDGNEASVVDQFEALSYSWGYPKDLTTIDLRGGADEAGGLKLYITPSAESAIRRLRHPTREVKLWIDAVCICQTDVDERAQQVSMMATIFSSARNVRVWLGEHEGIEAALRVIRDVYNYNHRVCPGGNECSCEGTRHSSVSDIEQSDRQKELRQHKGIKVIYGYHWNKFGHQAREYSGGVGTAHVSKLFSNLFDSPWFRRSWVIREVLAAKSCTVHCGPETITWTELVDVNEWLTDPKYIAGDPHVLLEQVVMPTIWSSLLKERAANHQVTVYGSLTTSTSAPGILDVYLDSLDFKSTEARDKLYAVLSVSKETSQPNLLPDLLQPNYLKTDQQVFADFTIWWIREYRSLSILSAVHCQNDRTWVRTGCDSQKVQLLQRPTWVVPSSGKGKWWHATLNKQFKFRAGAATSFNVDLLNDQSEQHSARLRVEGYEIGHIEELTYLHLDGVTKDKQQLELFSVYDALLDPANRHHQWKERPGEDVDLSLYGNRLGDHLQAHWAYFHRSKVPATGLINGKSSRKEIDTVPTCLDPFAFTMSNGRMGLSPWSARKNDIVVLLFGGNVPYLIRSTSIEDGAQAFELVGECYVVGIMQGQLMEELCEKRTQPRTFTLI